MGLQVTQFPYYAPITMVKGQNEVKNKIKKKGE
jgi:hypothetical protein